MNFWNLIGPPEREFECGAAPAAALDTVPAGLTCMQYRNACRNAYILHTVRDTEWFDVCTSIRKVCTSLH